MDVLKRTRVLAPPAATLAAAGAAFAWISAELFWRAQGLRGAAFDQAFFQQVVWRLGHGYGFTSSFSGGSFLGLHFEPLLAVPALLEIAWPDDRMLTLIHAAGLAAAAPCAYLFIRAVLPTHQAAPWLAAALAAPIPFWAEMQEAALADFHPESLAVPLGLLAAWSGLRGRRGWFWLFAIATLSAKEDQVYTVVVIALLAFFRGPEAIRRHAVALGAGATVWGIALLALVMPALRAGSSPATGAYYYWLLSPSATDLLAALYHPLAGLLFLGMLASMAGLPLLAPRWLALDLPPLAADVLSHHVTQPDLHLHYGLILMLPMVVAGAVGAARLLEGIPAPSRPGSRTGKGGAALSPGACAALALPALIVGFSLGRLPPAAGSNPSSFNQPESLAALHRCADAVPPGAPLAADDDVAAPLAGRPRLYVLPQAPDDSFLVVDRAAFLHGYIDTTARATLLSSLPQSGRRLLKDDGRFQVWSPVGG